MATKGPTGLPEPTVWRFLVQLLLALRSIHAQNIIHRDIRPLNIFLDQTGSIMVGNFALTSLPNICETDSAAFIADTPLYMSPERCSGSACDEKSDVWALGVVLYECCTGKHPFMASNMPELASQINTCKPALISKDTYRQASSHLLPLLAHCDAFSAFPSHSSSVAQYATTHICVMCYTPCSHNMFTLKNRRYVGIVVERHLECLDHARCIAVLVQTSCEEPTA